MHLIICIYEFYVMPFIPLCTFWLLLKLAVDTSVNGGEGEASHSMHLILCISFYASHSMHLIICISLYASHSMHLCILVYAFYTIAYILTIVKTRCWHFCNWRRRRRTRVTYRAAIAAKNAWNEDNLQLMTSIGRWPQNSKSRQPSLEDDLKISKVKYLSNHSSDLS